MALARRRCCYSIERLLRGLHQILSPFPSPPASPAPFPPGPPPSSSSSTFSHPPPLVAAQRHTHTHTHRREEKRRENRFLSFCRSRRRPSVSFLSLRSLLVTRRRPHAVVPGWRHPPSPPSSPLLLLSVQKRRGEESAVRDPWPRPASLSILSH